MSLCFSHTVSDSHKYNLNTANKKSSRGRSLSVREIEYQGSLNEKETEVNLCSTSFISAFNESFLFA